MVADSAAKRIDFLVASYLKKIAIREGGWTTLYQDPQDGRYWERTFPQSETQGGGPPVLKVISDSDARTLYNLL